MTASSAQWVHMVGIGGAGMSGIAKVLAEQGIKVSGSDLQSSEVTRKLADQGVIVYMGHSSANLKPGVDLVVASSAIPQDNSELAAARQAGIPILKRGQMLAYMVNNMQTGYVKPNGEEEMEIQPAWIVRIGDIEVYFDLYTAEPIGYSRQ